MRAWIREGLDGWIQMNYEASSHGLQKRGWDVQRYRDPETPQIEIQEGDIVHGPIEEVRPAVEEDASLVEDYPQSLRPFLQNQPFETTLGEVRGHTGYFVKPVEHKKFTGLPIRKESDWISLRAFDADTEVYCFNLVDFESEWRVYVREGEVLHVGRYKGDPVKFPSRNKISSMIHAYQEDSPASYALDVANTSYGTVLVEVNDAFFAGVYGIDPVPYAKFLEARWEEYWG